MLNGGLAERSALFTISIFCTSDKIVLNSQILNNLLKISKQEIMSCERRRYFFHDQHFLVICNIGKSNK